MLGHDVGGVRLPIVEVDEHEREVIRGALERHGLLAAAGAVRGAPCASCPSAGSARSART